jgi:hypothetical protein
MTLKELQSMIKEELESYINEEEVDVDVDTDAGDIDADGAESGDDSEAVLRQIYDMLKDKFEGEEDAADDAADMDEADVDEYGSPMDEAKKEEDLEEAKKDEEDMKEEVSHLQERFQKLANIIK